MYLDSVFSLVVELLAKKRYIFILRVVGRGLVFPACLCGR